MPKKLIYEERVPTQGLREALIRQVGRGETTLAQVAILSDFTRKKPNGRLDADTTALQRALGAMPRTERTGRDPVTGERDVYTVSWCTIAEDKALKIMHALNLDPVDVGF